MTTEETTAIPGTGDSMAGRVIAVTGAGRGIGRAIAVLAAREGAHVVVNDLGGSTDGGGDGASQPADEVVDEITAFGGSAVANHSSVADPEGARSIVVTAVDTFGRIDSVVNNAGILRDRIFHKMEQEDWEKVLAVHLHGAWNTSRAAAPFFKEQGSGSFVHFVSMSALVGNYGQANYMAAKMGIVGLSKAIALDMERYGVRSNVVAPFAWSRLVQIPEDDPRVARQKTMTPETVAPLVVFLASDLARDVTGQIFAVRKNEVHLFSQPRPIRSVHRSEGWTPATLADHMLPSVAGSLYPLDRSGDLFAYDPV
ncbi:SDR family oxidoreductase [Nocardioides sediminis]|uniref:SDR family oxidoreductase n=1 Tax=Nocardioides sediminis TaxID=433648 RepID=UPI000D2FFAE0|nr:SDR family oxidoreductase [Nocardioides sediminis]